MNEGTAVGGPLDGTKLSAPQGWNGRVERDLTGAYTWDVTTCGFVWRLLDRPLSPRVGRPIGKSRKKTSEGK